MDQQTLHRKIIEYSHKNKKNLTSIHNHITTKRKDYLASQQHKYNNYLKDYDELIKFSKESEQQNYRLKKELALVDIQIEELSFKNKMSRSRIKDHNHQIQNIKDETFDIDRQKRKQLMVSKEYSELKAERDELEREVNKLEEGFQKRRRGWNEVREGCEQKEVRKSYLEELQKQSRLKNQQKFEQLQSELRSIKAQISEVGLLKQREQKTKRNSKKLRLVDEIRQEVHKIRSAL